MIKLLFLILFVLLIVIGQERGVKTFLLFFSGLLLIAFYIIIVSAGVNAILLALIMSILITIIELFGLNGYNVKTKSSFLSVMIVVFVVGLLLYFVGMRADIQGFSTEDIETIGAFSFNINVNIFTIE